MAGLLSSAHCPGQATATSPAHVPNGSRGYVPGKGFYGMSSIGGNVAGGCY